MKLCPTLALLAFTLLVSTGLAQGRDTYNGRNIRFLYINDTSQMTSVDARSKLQQLHSAGINVIPVGGPIGQMASQLSTIRQDPLLSRFKIMLSISNATFDGWNSNQSLACAPGSEALPAWLQSDLDHIAALGKGNADIVAGYYAFDEPALSGICKRYQELVYRRIRQADADASARPVVIANTMHNMTPSQVAERMSADAQDIVFIDQYASDESTQTQYFNLWKNSGVLQDPVVYILPTFSTSCIDPRLRSEFQPRLDAALNNVYGTHKPVSYGVGYFSFWANHKNPSDFTHDIDNCSPMLESAIDHLTQRADLKIERIDTIPADFRPGESVQLKVRMRNAGSVATPNGWHGVLLRENGACFASGCAWGGFTGSLGAGQETDVVIDGGATWQPGAGLKRLSATVDDQYLIQETRDDNNTLIREIAVGDKPDLITWSLKTTPSSFTPGTSATFSTWIENRGSVSTPQGWIGVLYTVDNACPGSGCIWGGVTGSLAPGQGMWLHTNSAAPWSTTPGSHVIRAVVDDSGQIPEFNETNNTTARDLIVSDKPDLRIASIRTEPALPRAGDAVSFVATVENRGSVAMSAPWLGMVAQQNNACFANGCVWGGQQNAVLQPGQSSEIRTYSGAWLASPGQHTLQIRIDDGASIPEADESNNMIEVPIFVP